MDEIALIFLVSHLGFDFSCGRFVWVNHSAQVQCIWFLAQDLWECEVCDVCECFAPSQEKKCSCVPMVLFSVLIPSGNSFLKGTCKKVT